MEIYKLLVGVFSISGIAFTCWFFLMKREDEPVAVKNNSVDIAVDGGYSPSVISIPKNQQTTLNFFRKDSSSCLEEIVLPYFKVRKYLPLNKITSLQITPKKSGTFELSCGMNMFHGKIIVEDPEQSRRVK